MKEIIFGFRQFIVRGNVLDLAVGIVIGASFGSVVNSLVGDVFTPVMGALTNTTDLSKLIWTINGSEIKYGSFLNAILSFIIVSFAVYFFVVLPMAKFWRKKEEGGKVSVLEDTLLLREIRDSLKNC